MSAETLRPPQGDLPERLKTANGLTEVAIRQKFGPPLESVKAPGLDQIIGRPEIGATIIKNPQVIKLAPQLNLQTQAKTEPAAGVVEVKLDTPAIKEITGKQLAFSIGSYGNLYNQILEASGGNKELAEADTYKAILRDGTSFIQESITAQKNEAGELIIDDPIFQGKAQQTATVHSLLQVKDPHTGKDVITSPEYVATKKSIRETITGWRRGNDHAVVSLIEHLVNNVPELPDNESYTLLWASPKAESWEDQWIRKYNGEYGYQYVGHLTGPAGARKLLVHSYKADINTQTFASFMDSHKGESHQVASEDEKERPLLDKLMRSVKVVKGSLSSTEVISGLYKAKKQLENSNTMFGILENTMHFTQDQTLRQRIENEASSPVAHWIVRHIVSGTADNITQDEILNKYTQETVSLMKKFQLEEQEKERLKSSAVPLPSSVLMGMPKYYLENNPFSDDKAFIMADLQRRTQTAGAFCGEVGTSSISFGTDPIQDLINNYTGIAGGGGNIFSGGGLRLSSGEVTHCGKCGDHLCGTGKCNKCNITYKK